MLPLFTFQVRNSSLICRWGATVAVWWSHWWVNSVHAKFSLGCLCTSCVTCCMSLPKQHVVTFSISPYPSLVNSSALCDVTFCRVTFSVIVSLQLKFVFSSLRSNFCKLHTSVFRLQTLCPVPVGGPGQTDRQTQQSECSVQVLHTSIEFCCWQWGWSWDQSLTWDTC
jgi:hypothetical protein